MAFDPLTRLTVLRTLLSTPHGVNEDHIGNGWLVERRTENVHAFHTITHSRHEARDQKRMERIQWCRNYLGELEEVTGMLLVCL